MSRSKRVWQLLMANFGSVDNSPDGGLSATKFLDLGRCVAGVGDLVDRQVHEADSATEAPRPTHGTCVADHFPGSKPSGHEADSVPEATARLCKMGAGLRPDHADAGNAGGVGYNRLNALVSLKSRAVWRRCLSISLAVQSPREVGCALSSGDTAIFARLG